uniref:Uncharacterized protein n=1 Tax=Octopus bimaculoides TaxID=37653 RepID=A0A0L8FJ15_OCTBM
MYSSSNLEHHGSFNELKRLKIKHVRNVKGPTEMYLQPNTTSQELGWHYKEHFTMSQKPSWTYIERWPIIQNEMTRFVDHMKRNDRDFILF